MKDELIHITDDEGKVIETWISAGAMYEGLSRRYRHLQAKRRMDIHHARWKGFWVGASVMAVIHLILFLIFKFLL